MAQRLHVGTETHTHIDIYIYIYIHTSSYKTYKVHMYRYPNVHFRENYYCFESACIRKYIKYYSKSHRRPDSVRQMVAKWTWRGSLLNMIQITRSRSRSQSQSQSRSRSQSQSRMGSLLKVEELWPQRIKKRDEPYRQGRCHGAAYFYGALGSLFKGPLFGGKKIFG